MMKKITFISEGDLEMASKVEGDAKQSQKKTVWGLLSVVGVFLIGKMKWVLAFLKFLKLKTFISMVIFLGTYAFLYGWKFGVALVYLLLVHEAGHSFAAKKIKLPTSPAIFIPFMGAFVGMKERPKSAKDEAFVAYMGPLFGLLSILPAIPLYMLTKEPFWALIIVVGSILNLFNLIPMSPLDGGRIVAAISTKLWGVGLVILLAYVIWIRSFILFFIIILGIIQWFNIRNEQKNVDDDRNRVKKYKEMLESLKNIAQTSTFEHLQYFAQNLSKDLENETELQKTLLLLYENVDEEISEEEREHKRQQMKQEFIIAFEKEVENIHNYVEQTAAYYQTPTKAKVGIFFIYLALVTVLGISSYLSYSLLPPID